VPPGAAHTAPRLERSGWTRRHALLGGAAAAGTCLGAGSVWSFLRDLGRDATPADVFKGDAPRGEVWDLWERRGWVREARHYLRLDRNVQCKVCPNNCLLTPGDRSHCRNKVNHDGKLYTLAYANPCTFHVDPVEKKPLFHFLPGSRSFSLATSGCVFRCLNCQNWEISQKKPEETKDPRGAELRLRPPLPDRLTAAQMRSLSLFPEDLGAVAAALGCPSVSYTYSEPTAFYEYAYDACEAVHRRGLKNVLVSCGSIEERPLRDLAAHVDAAHVDLKGFDDAIYRKLNSGRLEPILGTLRTLKSVGVWVEIVNLVVPTHTDRVEIIRRMCDWVVAQLGPDVPLHFSRFHPHHHLAHLPPTPVEILVRARDAARAAGLRYVYIGNVPGLADAETTFCPGCRRAIIERDVFSVTRNDLTDGRCRHCRQRIAGVWTASPAAG
jgi:pyruvate formate lyase activating enzyme